MNSNKENDNNLPDFVNFSIAIVSLTSLTLDPFLTGN
jgi:hypothetical protein